MIQIVVAGGGWVFVGKFTMETQTIEHAWCIRIWGTSRGLGELINGPTEKTILDPMGTLHLERFLFTMEVNQDAWIGLEPVISEPEGS